MRLATFNILHGRSPTDGRVDLDRFAGAVRDLDADVLALQEVDRDQPRSCGADLTAVAADAMSAPEHRFVAAMVGNDHNVWTAATGEEQPGTASFGVALLSRYPVTSWQMVRLPALRRRVPMVFPGRRRPVLVEDEARVALAAAVDSPRGLVTVVTTHLSFLPGWNVWQLRRLLRHLDARPLVVMGDLNMTLAAAVRTSGLRPLAEQPTFPSDAPRRQLDHILSNGFSLPSAPAVAVRLPLSDHRALSVEV